MTHQKSPKLSLLAHNIRSLYNIGSIFRLADGLGIDMIYLSGISGTPATNPKNHRQRQQIAKTALAGLEAVDWQYLEDPQPLLQSLRQSGVQIVGLEITNTSRPLSEFTFKSPSCLVIGHETEGIDQDILQYCHHQVHIPMLGQGHSLNVSTAAAIALYQMSQQTRIAD